MHVDRVQFDSKELWQLADVAEKRGLTVPGLLAALAKDLLNEAQPTPPVPAPTPKKPQLSYEELCLRIAHLRSLELSDMEIAKRLDVSTPWVQRIRAQMGLPSVGRGRPSKERAERKAAVLQRLDAQKNEAKESK
jgi:hypothetical protein